MSTDQLSPTPLNPVHRWLLPTLGALLAFSVVFGAVRMRPAQLTPISHQPGEAAPSQLRPIAGIDKGSFTAVGETGALEAAAIVNVERQAAFLKEAARREAEDWAALSATERAEKRAELKASMLEGQ